MLLRLTSRTRQRLGLTLIEVLVSVTIIGILAALLIPAVQAARETARKSMCAGNARQLAIALQSYAASFQVFPQGTNGRGFSLHVMTLPYLDNVPLYNAINLSQPVWEEDAIGGGNETALLTHVNVLVCPSDRKQIGRFGEVSYPGNGGDGIQKFGQNGIFVKAKYGPVGLQDISDGSSSTAALAEWAMKPIAPRSNEANRLIFRTSGSFFDKDDFDRFVAACREADPRKDPFTPDGKGNNWLHGDFSQTLYNHAISINGHSCTNAGRVQEGAWTSGSSHGGGAHVAFADGHVRFVAETISSETWRALGSRQGGEVVRDPAF